VIETAGTSPAPNFDHLVQLTDHQGTHEHALFASPRPEHGYCTDDMARVLVVTSRQPDATPVVRDLITLSLRFLDGAIDGGGTCRNRMRRDGVWEDKPGVADCWGRAIWGLGSAASHCDDTEVARAATMLFNRSCVQRSTWPRAMAFAGLGAAELLERTPDHVAARVLLSGVADLMQDIPPGIDWIWPEPRLTYANAILPEVMIAAGSTLGRPGLLDRGLELLSWLLERESFDGHLSLTPAGGAGPLDTSPQFDQQPIEAAAMADACTRATGVDGDQRWTKGVESAVNWFLGYNDSQVVMRDPSTGGGFDGLQRDGANLNQGAESTLALLSTLQHGRSLALVAR
jgi:hypothetical protein